MSARSSSVQECFAVDVEKRHAHQMGESPGGRRIAMHVGVGYPRDVLPDALGERQ